jgi:hypothetical protein
MLRVLFPGHFAHLLNPALRNIIGRIVGKATHSPSQHERFVT